MEHISYLGGCNLYFLFLVMIQYDYLEQYSSMWIGHRDMDMRDGQTNGISEILVVLTWHVHRSSETLKKSEPYLNQLGVFKTLIFLSYFC
jgi:hypothetical protein